MPFRRSVLCENDEISVHRSSPLLLLTVLLQYCQDRMWCMVNHQASIFPRQARPVCDGWMLMMLWLFTFTLKSVNLKSRGIVRHCLQVWGQLPTSGECPHVTDVLSRYLIQIILMIIGLGDWWGPALRARGRTSQTAKHHQCHGGRLPWSFSSVISCPGPGLALRHASCPDIWRYDGCQLYW